MKNNRATILIIDDAPEIRKFIASALLANDYSVLEAASGQAGIGKMAMESPDLVLLDLGLPDEDGLEVLKKIREWSNVPVLILSVRDSETEKVTLLDAGADDYITKPFDIKELMARIRVGLRRFYQNKSESAVLRFGALKIDLSQRSVFVDDQRIKLSKKEYDLLRLLATNAGRVLTQQQLLEEVWGKVYVDQLQYLRVYIGQLRQKLASADDDNELILTESGVGYRFREQDVPNQYSHDG